MIEESSQRRGWRVVGASALGVFFTTVPVFTFALLLRPLTEEFGWSRGALSAAFGGMTLAVALAAPFAGRLVDRFGPRRLAAPSLFAVALAFASLALLTGHLWQLYATYAVLGLASAGTSPVVYARVVSGWFDRRRGIALAATIAGIGVGGVIHPPVMQALIRSLGWRQACIAFALLMIALGVTTVGRAVQAPESAGPRAAPPDGDAARVALRRRAFWTVLVVVFGSTVAMNGTVAHLSALVTDRGYGAAQAVMVMSLMGAASLCGRLLTGWLLDRLHAVRVSCALLVIAAAGTLLLSTTSSLGGAMLAAVLIGFGTGGEVDVTPYLLSRYFGLRAMASLYGITWLAFGLAGLLGPIAMGRAFDATGSYDAALAGFAVVTFLSAGLTLTLPAYQTAPASVAAAGSR